MSATGRRFTVSVIRSPFSSSAMTPAVALRSSRTDTSLAMPSTVAPSATEQIAWSDDLLIHVSTTEFVVDMAHGGSGNSRRMGAGAADGGIFSARSGPAPPLLDVGVGG